MAQPIVNPELPYIGEVPSGLQPGKMIRFQGVTHRDSDRFNINLAAGPNPKPRDDTSLHLSVRLNQGYIARNTYKGGAWGNEEGDGNLPIGQGESFEIIILCTPDHYKIAVNGQHFCEFPYRVPYEQVTSVLVDGDVAITLISFEGIPLPSNETASQASPVHSQGPQLGQYGPPAGQYGGYAPPMPPGAQPQSQSAGFFEQAQDMLAGAIKSGAAEKLLSSIMSSGGQQQQAQGYAHQNARYGIYPDLPTQDNTPVPQPTSQETNHGPIEGLLMGLLSGKKEDGQKEGHPEQGQGGDVLSGILSSLMNNQGQGQSQSGGGQEQNIPAGQQSQGGDMLSGLLSGLMNNQGQGQSQSGGGHEQNVPAGQQSQGGDMLSGLLSSLMNNQGQSSQGQGQNVPVGQQNQGSDAISGLLSSFFTPSQNQQPNQPPQSDVLSGIMSNLEQSNPEQKPAQPQSDPQPANPNVAMLTGLLQGLMSKAAEQHDSTRPIQETHPEQQYGQYPHPPQEQRGPVESLLSGLLSGGGQQQQQQPQPSIGGMGSMGGILGSLAGSLLHRPDHNQGH